MNPMSPGTILIVIGVGLILVGLLIWSGSLSWFGRLPGDIRIERETVRVYVPIVSMLVVSLVAMAVNLVVQRRAAARERVPEPTVPAPPAAQLAG